MVHTLERWLRQETNEEVQEKICMALELMTCTEIHPQRRRQSARLAEFIVNLTLVKFRQTYWVMEEHTPKPFLGNSIKDVTEPFIWNPRKTCLLRPLCKRKEDMLAEEWRIGIIRRNLRNSWKMGRVKKLIEEKTTLSICGEDID
ncbi:hypothetical protein DINM_006308 [Dirofilaria immitis]|nr:hypothetical protein [Dirofilaria immitis]